MTEAEKSSRKPQHSLVLRLLPNMMTLTEVWVNRKGRELGGALGVHRHHLAVEGETRRGRDLWDARAPAAFPTTRTRLGRRAGNGTAALACRAAIAAIVVRVLTC